MERSLSKCSCLTGCIIKDSLRNSLTLCYINLKGDVPGLKPTKQTSFQYYSKNIVRTIAQS